LAQFKLVDMLVEADLALAEKEKTEQCLMPVTRTVPGIHNHVAPVGGEQEDGTRVADREKIFRLLDAIKIVLEPGAVRALARWPKFSLTSFKMVSDLARQGIIPRTVIDVGANVGQFAVAAAMVFPNAAIHTFEPDPKSVERLRANTSSLRNVTIYPIGLGDSEGTVELRVNSHSLSSSILQLATAHRAAFPEAREIGTVTVKLSTLDSIFSQIELATPVLLKLDVQGYEAMTLRGGTETLKRVQYAVLEASLKPMYDGEVLFLDLVHMMEGFGCTFLRPIGSLANPATGEVLQMDVLFGRVV
jgi:FkbM family methyltransferase